MDFGVGSFEELKRWSVWAIKKRNRQNCVEKCKGIRYRVLAAKAGAVPAAVCP